MLPVLKLQKKFKIIFCIILTHFKKAELLLIESSLVTKMIPSSALVSKKDWLSSLNPISIISSTALLKSF